MTMATATRLPLSAATMRPRRQTFCIASAVSSTLFLLVALASMSYLFGSTFHNRLRWHNMAVLAVHANDSDAVSSALRTAYHSLDGDVSPRIVSQSAANFDGIAAVRSAVCRAEYWAAIYVHEAESRPSVTVTFTYNAVRWPVAGQRLLESMASVMDAAQTAYARGVLQAARRSNTSTAAIAAAVGPQSPFRRSQLRIDPICATRQGSAGYLTTINFVFPVLLQLFLILTLNGLCQAFQLHARVAIAHVWVARFVIGKIFTLLSACVVAGYIFAFREDWQVPLATGFPRTLAIYWLFLDINWLLFETLLGAYVSVRFLSPFVFVWLVVNIASTSQPLELMPAFYRVGRALPAHNTLLLLIRAWSGCGSGAPAARCVLFAWWTVWSLLSPFGIRRRCLAAEHTTRAAAPESDDDA